MLESIGESIAGINAELARRQLEVSSAAFAHNMMVAERTVGDLTALVHGVNAEGATSVGIAMRENLELERGNTVIQRRMTVAQHGYAAGHDQLQPGRLALHHGWGQPSGSGGGG